MNKKILIITILIVCIVIATGIAFTLKRKNEINSNIGIKENLETETKKEVDATQRLFEENCTLASIAEIAIGDHLLVVGEENELGIVVAEKIRIGFAEDGMGDRLFKAEDNASTKIRLETDGSGRTPPINKIPSGVGRNLSPEEREAKRSEMKTNINQSQDALIQGMVMEINEDTITLELKEGSKLIFFSDVTEFYKKIED